eukprot:13759123-Heterocapsa_arctica.AAC.1
MFPGIPRVVVVWSCLSGSILREVGLCPSPTSPRKFPLVLWLNPGNPCLPPRPFSARSSVGSISNGKRQGRIANVPRARLAAKHGPRRCLELARPTGPGGGRLERG